MEKYTANYSYSNHNFVIQNLKGKRINNEYLPAICILKNILQRGKPTLLSKYLQEYIGSIHKTEDFKKSYPLISNKLPNWERIIRGDVKNNNFPAKIFFETVIPEYLSEYKYIQQLLIPEFPINQITQIENKQFENQQVDFYLPQAYLIIEIDGSQHADSKVQDDKRDQYTAKYYIETIRIKISDLEAKNNTFENRIEQIKKRIDRAITSQDKRQNGNNFFISIKDYDLAFNNGIDLENPNYKATAIMRFQIFILELLEKGYLNFSQEWKFELFLLDISDFADLAINDLYLWLNAILKLQKIEWKNPGFTVKTVDSIEEFSNSRDSIKVSFSLLDRYTDEFQIHPDIFFIRTDYLDEYRYFKNSNSQNPSFPNIEQYDYFRVSTAKSLKYDLKFGGKTSDEIPLLFLLENIFIQDIPNLSFNEGQLAIIANALALEDTIGLLPTGSGKSVCYQLAAILQPAISFVVCPIKSLMYDQKEDLDSVFFSRTNHITGDDDGEAKDKIQNEFARGKYLFIFISPERFQIKTFREYFSLVNKDYNIAYAVIDEVHCLSEWGHDFRISYLNLSKTIQKLCSNFNFIGLTATASMNVLKDIKIEFNIDNKNIITQLDYTRPELEFEVIDDKGDKLQKTEEILRNYNNTDQILALKGNNAKCGIIFTPTVNGKQGCFKLSMNLSKHLQTEINYYSGSTPKFKKKDIMSTTEYADQKKLIQEKFKDNKFTILTATKAFGMGINKPNIYFTIHYGIPSSMESLYQEGGRAGRDREKFKVEKAKCTVLLTKAQSNFDINKLWDLNTQLSEFNNLSKDVKGDLNSNLYLFSSGLDEIDKEYLIIKSLFDKYAVSNKKNVCITGTSINTSKAKTEKAIYRLSQLGIIEDWTIKNFFGRGEFEVDFTEFEVNSEDNKAERKMKESLLQTIKKYDPDFSIDQVGPSAINKQYVAINNNSIYSYSEKYIRILLQWSYNHFVYNRRQSQKTIYENCCSLSDGNISKNKFRTILENYFKVTESGYVLQYIAENPLDIRWFDVFFKFENNERTSSQLDDTGRNALQATLSRFLESYMHNTGMDLISGLLRLLLDDYENIDGRPRLESSLKVLKYSEQDNIYDHLLQILTVGKEMSEKNKIFLAESLFKYFDDDLFVREIQKELKDPFSMTIILEDAGKKIQKLKETFYE